MSHLYQIHRAGLVQRTGAGEPWLEVGDRQDTGETVGTSAPLACVVLAHQEPAQVRRLIKALEPFPVFLHCDARAPDDVFRAIVQDLPPNVYVLERRATGWATWGLVEAELDGYTAALRHTTATHIALLTGADYPLASSEAIRSFLTEHLRKSFALYHRLPYNQWGRSGGFARLRYRHYAWRKHMIRLPFPRRLPADVAMYGGSQVKVLARHHVEALLDACSVRPDLVRFWRRTWVPDETFVASILNTYSLVPGWASEHVGGSLWYIRWDGPRRKSPPWLGVSDYGALREGRFRPADGTPRLFARKFSMAVDSAVLDAIDSSLRSDGYPL